MAIQTFTPAPKNFSRVPQIDNPSNTCL